MDMPPLCQVLEEDPSCYPQMTGHWFRCSETIQEPLTLKPAINWELLEHQSHCAQWSEFYITMDWEGADQEWSSCSKIYDFKVWLRFTSTHMIKPKLRFIAQTRPRLGYSVFQAQKTLYQLFSMVMIAPCSGTICSQCCWYIAQMNGIIKKKD